MPSHDGRLQEISQRLRAALEGLAQLQQQQARHEAIFTEESRATARWRCGVGAFLVGVSAALFLGSIHIRNRLDLRNRLPAGLRSLALDATR